MVCAGTHSGACLYVMLAVAPIHQKGAGNIHQDHPSIKGLWTHLVYHYVIAKYIVCRHLHLGQLL